MCNSVKAVKSALEKTIAESKRAKEAAKEVRF